LGLRYFINNTDIDIADNDDTAARLIEQGFTEVDYETFRRAWDLKDTLRIERSIRENGG
jgi:hypothetical protein